MIFFKARYKKGSTTGQTLVSHLDDVSAYSKLFAETINLSKFAALAGLLHDLGKGCRSWQKYLDNQVKLGKTSNKEDHATAGGQFLYKRIMQNPVAGAELVGQLLAACVMYHHGPGLPDVIKPDGTAQLHERLLKDTEETRLEEAVANIDPVIKQKLDDILQDKDFVPETIKTLGKLIKIRNDKTNRFFNLGFTARLLASCLIDADRLDSAYYERGIPCILENATKKINWEPLLISLENHLAGLPNRGKINEIRRDISAHCAEYGLKENGIYTLSAATGAGKTLASLRYALTHAKEYDKERIFIIAPYTSILDQNADEIRNILDPKGKNGEIILEHHSNLDRSEESEYYVDSTETWNVPIIITTMVQFLEVLFGSGTRKIRRMHRLTNSVIIFDEIQTLPVSCTYLFTWALEYLCQNAGVSALLCTATQPGLDRLKSEYALRLNASNEIVPSIVQHFTDLKRVELVDETKLG
ncbi:MAG: CRISPR-associated endonuclease Cas3'', partial [Treponema sp.]|nr:CRISPR-associated endonuclease Cas3'' [Treponema sp.]